MFELIRANRRKSAVLIFLMLLVLLIVGALIGMIAFPVTESYMVGSFRFIIPMGALIGMAVSFLIWGVQALVAFSGGDSVLMAVAGAKQIRKQDHPQLFNVVEEMAIAAQLPAVPKVYIIEDMSLNAFAAGRSPEHAAVAITQGLLAKLNRDQLQGVIAHEIAHIANRDILFMTFATIMLGSIVLITELFLLTMRFSTHAAYNSSRFSTRKSKDNGALLLITLVLLLFAWILSIIAPLMAQLLYFACSRQREYLADAGGAVYTRYPEGLASALEVIAGNPGQKESTSKVLAPLYIINPLEAREASLSSLTSTHPPIAKRIRILRAMGGVTSYQSYAAAAKMEGNLNDIHMPAAAFATPTATAGMVSGAAAHRAATGGLPQTAPQTASPPPTPKTSEPTPRQRYREAADLVRSVNGFLFLSCTCGLKAKIPPTYKKSQVQCPRCGKIYPLQ
ncbi:MAG: M48 family metallopeptidase [Candidatus Hydrogenedentes bacterium]|nr:M48 family metallopeptidase [Candidatus Hydrogenedentota bacterium]